MSSGSNEEVINVAPTRSAPQSLLRPERQAELFPLRAVLEFPNAVNGADVWGKIIADDDNTYIVKGDKGGANVPASEWVGTHIAEALNVRCAPPRVIQMLGGQLLFGSREIQGAASQAETALLLTTITRPPAKTVIPGLTAALSEIYVLDMFLNNVDRHEGNFVCGGDGDTRAMYVIDFARCLFWNNSLDAFPGANHQTVVRARELRARHGFDLEAASGMIHRIEVLAPEPIVSIISQMPAEWLTGGSRKEFLMWWASERRRQKLHALRKGLNDGSLL